MKLIGESNSLVESINERAIDLMDGMEAYYRVSNIEELKQFQVSLLRLYCYKYDPLLLFSCFYLMLCYLYWWNIILFNHISQHNPRKQTSQTKNEINLLMEWIVGGVWLDWIVVGYGWGPSPLPRMNSIPDNSCLSFRHSCSFFIKYRKAKNKRHQSLLSFF